MNVRAQCRWALEHDNATIFFTSLTHTVFCVSDPSVDATNGATYPFLWVGQVLAAKKLLIMPNSSLHRIAAELGHPDDRDVTLIHISARYVLIFGGSYFGRCNFIESPTLLFKSNFY